MTSRKKESALGRGLDALIRPEIDEVMKLIINLRNQN